MTAAEPRPFNADDWRAVLTRYGYPPNFFEEDPEPSPPRQLLLFDVDEDPSPLSSAMKARHRKRRGKSNKHARR